MKASKRSQLENMSPNKHNARWAPLEKKGECKKDMQVSCSLNYALPIHICYNLHLNATFQRTN